MNATREVDSTLSERYQTTVPAQVRRALNLNKRDRIHYSIRDNGEVVLTRAVGLSQAEFAELLGVSRRTLQDWEQGRRKPTGAAQTLLRVAVRHPEALRDSL